MSKRVQHTLEVLTIVKLGKPESPAGVKRMVALASDEVAKIWGVETSTVTAKFRRPNQLGFNGMDDFRRAVSGWLFNGTSELEDVLMASAGSEDDRRAVQRLFALAVQSYELTRQDSGWRLTERYGNGRVTVRNVKSLGHAASLIKRDEAVRDPGR